MNPEHLTSIRERLEKLYALSGVSVHSQVLETLKKLNGFVDFSVVPNDFTDLPEFAPDENLSGLYLNSQESFLLVTNHALYWRKNRNEIQTIPHENNHTLELRNIEDMLTLVIVLDSADKVVVPLVHDDPSIHIDDGTTYDDSFLSLNQIIKYDSELSQSLPEISDWLQDGHPFDSELLEVDINPDILKRKETVELLYSVLDATKEACETGQKNVSNTHPAMAHLAELENIVFTDAWLEQEESLSNHEKLDDLAVYFNDESNYIVLGLESLSIIDQNDKKVILYRSIDSIEVNEAQSFIDLFSGDNHLTSLPIVSISGDSQSATQIAQFLQLMSTKESIEDIDSKGDLLRYLINQYKRIPFWKVLVEQLDSQIPPNLELPGNLKEDFYRVVALLLSRPYSY